MQGLVGTNGMCPNTERGLEAFALLLRLKTPADRLSWAVHEPRSGQGESSEPAGKRRQ